MMYTNCFAAQPNIVHNTTTFYQQLCNFRILGVCMGVCTIAGFTTESLQYHQNSVSIVHISKDYLILGTVPSCSKGTHMVVCVCVWGGGGGGVHS